jgi:hypothetical protein
MLPSDIIAPAIIDTNHVMSVPDQVRDDVSGIQCFSGFRLSPEGQLFDCLVAKVIDGVLKLIF